MKFPDYIDDRETQSGLEGKELFEGILVVHTNGRDGVAHVKSGHHTFEISGSVARNRAYHGDTVVVKRGVFDSVRDDGDMFGRAIDSFDTDEDVDDSIATEPGHIVRISRANHRSTFACSLYGLQPSSGHTVLIPLDRLIPAVIIRGGVGSHPADTLFKVSLQEWASDCYLPFAQVEAILPVAPDNAQCVDALLIENGIAEEVRIPTSFDLHDARTSIDYAEADGRCDFSQHRVFTIDPEGCQDMDDAVSIETIEPNVLYRIHVHIADVAAFVKPGSDLDKLAAERATSVYFAQQNRTAHMLPMELATGLFSLLADKERLTVTYSFDVNCTDARLVPESFSYRRSVIRSSCALSYREADEMLRGVQQQSQLRCYIAKDLQLLRRCCHLLKGERTTKGALQLGDQNPQLNFQYDEGNVPVSCTPEERTPSHVIIEECALMVNLLVARELCQRSEPILLRVQNPPTNASQQKLALLHSRARLASPLDASSSKWLQSSLYEAQQHLPAELSTAVGKLVARHMQPASYCLCPASERLPHYSMNTHFTSATSPIRRYVDVIVTRLLLDRTAVSDAVLRHCNERAKVARAMQREAQEALLVAMLARHPVNVQAVVMEISDQNFTLAVPKFGLWNLKLHTSALEAGTNDMVRLHWEEDTGTLSAKASDGRIVWQLRALDVLEVSLAGRSAIVRFTCSRFALRVKPPGQKWAACTEHVEHPTCFRERTPFRCDISSRGEYLRSQTHLVWAHALWSCVTSPGSLRFQVHAVLDIRWTDYRARLRLSNPLLHGQMKYAVCVRHDGDDQLAPWCAHGVVHELKAPDGDRLKTVLCRAYDVTGSCPRSSADCWFAHGEAELKPVVYDMDIEFPQDQHPIPEDVRNRDNFTVEFLQIDVPFCRMLKMLDKPPLAEAVDRVIQPLSEKASLNMRPKLARLNDSQLLAVSMAERLPFVCIQGPPGTGKTSTAAAIVKHMLTLEEYRYSLNVLACAPSNKACDQLALKLHESGLGVVRMYASTIEDDPIFHAGVRNFRHSVYEPSAELLPLALHKLLEDTESFPVMKRLRHKFATSAHWTAQDRNKYETAYDDARKEVLSRCQVLVCTCVTAADFTRQRKQLFRAVLVDEAAQATEAETLLPALLASHKLILLGDQQQLGPTVSVKHGILRAALSRSMFERLAQDDRSRGQIHMLQEQYRMHPEICAFPSRTFYHDRLVTATEVRAREPIASEFPWRDQLRPLMFVDVENGTEQRTGDVKDELADGTVNPYSFCNKAEADVVVQAVNRLLNDCNITSEQIAIISPYQAQRVLIEQKFKSLKIPAPDIGTVHAFQGSERAIVIVSFVRSNERTVGFLRDPRMLNVSITRAQHGLICIGHQNTLMRCPEMAIMLRHLKECVVHPAYLKEASKHTTLLTRIASTVRVRAATKVHSTIATGKHAVAGAADAPTVKSDVGAGTATASASASATVAVPKVVYPPTAKKAMNASKKQQMKAAAKKQKAVLRAADRVAADAALPDVTSICSVQKCSNERDVRCPLPFCFTHWQFYAVRRIHPLVRSGDVSLALQFYHENAIALVQSPCPELADQADFQKTMAILFAFINMPDRVHRIFDELRRTVGAESGHVLSSAREVILFVPAALDCLVGWLVQHNESYALAKIGWGCVVNNSTTRDVQMSIMADMIEFLLVQRDLQTAYAVLVSLERMAMHFPERARLALDFCVHLLQRGFRHDGYIQFVEALERRTR